MFIIDRMKEKLVNNGCWPNEAEEIMQKAQAEPALIDMIGKWNEDEAGYPPTLSNILWLTVRQVAVDHLKATKPRHFAIGILDSY